jgi:hypothetical protein
MGEMPWDFQPMLFTLAKNPTQPPGQSWFQSNKPRRLARPNLASTRVMNTPEPFSSPYGFAPWRKAWEE